MKEKNEIENYEEKSKVLQENGWVTWYHDDNWIKTEWIVLLCLTSSNLVPTIKKFIINNNKVK